MEKEYFKFGGESVSVEEIKRKYEQIKNKTGNIRGISVLSGSLSTLEEYHKAVESFGEENVYFVRDNHNADVFI